MPHYLLWAFLGAASRYSILQDYQLDRSNEVQLCAKRAWKDLKFPWDGNSDELQTLDVIRTLLLVASIELTGEFLPRPREGNPISDSICSR